MRSFFRITLNITLALCLGLVLFSLLADSTNAFAAPKSMIEKSESANPAASKSALSDDNDATQDKDGTYRPSLIENIVTLGLLILLQAVLGFDNLLYISLESKNAPADKQKSVRAWGIGLAIGLRIGLLFLLYNLKEWFETVSVLEFSWNFAEGHFNIHSLIVLAGGAFIVYTAMKEIWHMTRMEHHVDDHGKSKGKSVASAIFWIVVMNVVFSFDSILSAMALTDVFWVMAAAIILSGLAMIWLSDRVADFLDKNRMYEVLGLFVLFVVGIMLISEGGHLAHLKLFGNAVTPMTKTTFYFVIAVLVLTDIVQGRYQKKLLAKKAHHEPVAP